MLKPYSSRESMTHEKFMEELADWEIRTSRSRRELDLYENLEQRNREPFVGWCKECSGSSELTRENVKWSVFAKSDPKAMPLCFRCQKKLNS